MCWNVSREEDGRKPNFRYRMRNVGQKLKLLYVKLSDTYVNAHTFSRCLDVKTPLHIIVFYLYCHKTHLSWSLTTNLWQTFVSISRLMFRFAGCRVQQDCNICLSNNFKVIIYVSIFVTLVDVPVVCEGDST